MPDRSAAPAVDAAARPGRAAGVGGSGSPAPTGRASGGGRRTAGSALVPRSGTGAFPVRPPVVSQGSAARFAERARARRRLAWRQILLVAGGVLSVAAVAWLLLLSPVLALEKDQVTVTGAGTVVAVDQVRAVVDAEDGTPLPRLDTARLRSELLDVPGVRDVTVSRDWPHGLTVALVSREPVAAVPESSEVAERADHSATDGEGGGFALVDQEGVQVGRADAPPEGLPVVEVPVGEGRILTATLGVLEALPEDLLAAIGQVSAGTQDTVQFTLRDGATVEWGSAQDSALKVAVLQALRAAPETAGSTRYDVSAPTMPVVG
ncbi:cell division protein FtsQ/DivIB [Cellulomonas sp. C5510]|uniref:cell division protein FtsQ/DivIB n=1 Tax=Cellulomonas sp. C5510 TaxID=2871170 RepID=UPI002106156B|nr:FtsQ-type POTRA domain-containing protein [Cellulomonas sp. C5510]